MASQGSMKGLTISIQDDASGGSLLERATAEDNLSEDKIAHFIRQLLQALSHLHAKETIHLDVKPENIMLSESGKDEIRLVDFGLSRKISRTGPTFGTMGTPEFVPPEVVKVEPVDYKSDVWSVGVLAYVMLSGMSPFLGDSDEETLKKVASGDYAFHPKAFGGVSEEAKDFIEKCLRLQPPHRLSVNEALRHPWLTKPQASPAKLSTQLLKEFRYRHQWVERRIFTQYGPDEDSVSVKSPRNTLEWMEPLYFPPPINQMQKPPSPAAASATFALPPLQSTATSNGHSAHAGGVQKSRSDPAVPTDGRQTPDDALDPTDPAVAALIQGEYRAIEDEIANRILSDISEEGSEGDLDERDADGKTPKSKGSARKQREREARMKALQEQLERDATPTRESMNEGREEAATPTKERPSSAASDLEALHENGVKRSASGTLVDAVTGAPIVVKGLRPITLDVIHGREEGTGSPSPSPSKSPSFSPGPGGCGKSPVRLSPTKEHVMEIIIGMKAAEEGRLPDHDDDAATLNKDGTRPADKANKVDPELEALMKEVDSMRRDMHKRREDILSGAEPRDPRRPAEMDFNLPPPPSMEYCDYEWDSTYQTGPETYLLALRDPGLTARIRDYRREICGDSFSRCTVGEIGERNLDITVRERRRYSDMMRQDVGVQKSVSFLQQAQKSQSTGAVRRVRSDLNIPAPPHATCLATPAGPGKPQFQQRLKEVSYLDEGRITMSVTVIGQPTPSIQWFHNDVPLVNGRRTTLVEEAGRSTLTIYPAYSTDGGVYSVSAWNEDGGVVCQALARMGDVPDRPTRPDVALASDTEVFMCWEPPASPFGQLDVLGYRLEIRRAGENDWAGEWRPLSDELDEEAAVVRGLDPLGIYQFRVLAKNAFGYGEPSLSSRIVRTHPKGAPKLNIELLRKECGLSLLTYHRSAPARTNGHVALEGIAEDAEEEEGTPTPDGHKPKSASLELNKSEGPEGRFQLEGLLFHGSASFLRNAVDKQSEGGGHCVVKVLLAAPEAYATAALAEFEALRASQHDSVVSLIAAYQRSDFLLLFQERLYESIAERFLRQDGYNEEQISRSLQQLLVALDWIHYKGIVHLNVQPENIVFAAKRTWQLKLIDFGAAVILKPDSASKPRLPPHPLYSAPELLQGAAVSTLNDMWNVGLLLYILLSGFHPWLTEGEPGKEAEELRRSVLEDKLDLAFVYSNATEEALKFLTWALAKEPGRRMRDSEALEHRFLAPHPALRRRREQARFTANRLRSWASEEFRRRQLLAAANPQLLASPFAP